VKKLGKIIVYGEIAQRIGKREIEITTKGKTVIGILREFAEKYNVKDLIFRDNKVRPIYLILINGRDYFSLGLLNERLEDEVEIKLVPTFHGG